MRYLTHWIESTGEDFERALRTFVLREADRVTFRHSPFTQLAPSLRRLSLFEHKGGDDDPVWVRTKERFARDLLSVQEPYYSYHLSPDLKDAINQGGLFSSNMNETDLLYCFHNPTFYRQGEKLIESMSPELHAELYLAPEEVAAFEKEFGISLARFAVDNEFSG